MRLGYLHMFGAANALNERIRVITAGVNSLVPAAVSKKERSEMEPYYKLGELAKFLKRTEKELTKLAENGSLKGRKVQGEWVFGSQDIVLWMEQEMIRMTPEETSEFEDAVVRADLEKEEFTLSEMLSPESIELEFPARTKPSIINEIVKLGERVGKLWDPETMAQALREREEKGSTAMGCGVAILHPQCPQTGVISENFLALAIASRPVPFGGGFDGLTDVFFLLCCETQAIHLRALAKLSRILKTPGFLDELRQCPDPMSICDLLAKAERELD